MVDRETLEAIRLIMQDELEPINVRLDKMQGNIEDIKGDVENVKGDIRSIRGDVENVKGDIRNIRGDVESVKEDTAITRESCNTLLEWAEVIDDVSLKEVIQNRSARIE